MTNTLRVGSDIEYAVRHRLTLEFLPAGILPITGRKGTPEPLRFGGVEIDCCGVEITPPPATTEDAFVSNISHLLAEVRERYSSHDIIAVPSVEFDPDLLLNTPYAMEMGCDPDFNAWTGLQNEKPIPRQKLRTFGGHVHIEGGTTNTVKACDLTLGMWSVLNDPDKQRRRMYGRAGAYRHKPYGVEYRVLSNFWTDRESHIRTVFQLVQTARQISDNVDELVTQYGGAEQIQEVINGSHVDEAGAIFTGVIEYAAA